jgi:hypothetical protein
VPGILVLGFLWLSLPAYLVLQVVAIARAKGTGLRVAAALPIPVMAALGALTVCLYWQQSNIWPLMLLLAGPPAFLYVLVFVVVSAIRKRR